jgi:hypothetical protein
MYYTIDLLVNLALLAAFIGWFYVDYMTGKDYNKEIDQLTERLNELEKTSRKIPQKKAQTNA